jgi:hypothetical protein
MKAKKRFSYSPYLSRPAYRPAWRSDGVDNGTIEENVAAAHRLGIEITPEMQKRLTGMRG